MKKFTCVFAVLLCLGMLLPVWEPVISANAAFIEGKPYNQYTYQEYMDLTKEEKQIFYNSFSSLGAFNRWFNAAKKAADDEKLVIGGQEIDLGAVLNGVAQIGTNKYKSVAAALEAAVAGDTILVVTDTQEDAVELKNGVTLDLNGKTLTVGEFAIVPGSDAKIVDTSEDVTGLLKVAMENAAFVSTDALSKNTLPMYDALGGGYRFYPYTYKNGLAYADAQRANAVEFWYQIQFDRAEPYELLYSGKSGVTFGALINYTGAAEPLNCVFQKDGAKDEWSKGYGAFVLGYDDGTVAQDPWMWIRVMNGQKAEDLTLAPVITAGGIDIELTAIAYNP